MLKNIFTLFRLFYSNRLGSKLIEHPSYTSRLLFPCHPRPVLRSSVSQLQCFAAAAEHSASCCSELRVNIARDQHRQGPHWQSRAAVWGSFVCLSLTSYYTKWLLPSVLRHCWLGGRKGIRPVKKTEWWCAGVVICLEQGADLHMAQQMPLPLTVSCFSKIQVGLPFWYRLTRVVLDKGPLTGCV